MNMRKKNKCTWCGKLATRQTVKGQENEKGGGLQVNNGYFCQKCWDKGTQIEIEAMYE